VYKIKYLDRKAIPTWVVTDGSVEVYFSDKNTSAFKHPYDEAVAYVKRNSKSRNKRRRR